MGEGWVGRLAGGVKALRNAFYAYAVAWAVMTFGLLFTFAVLGIIVYVGVSWWHGVNLLQQNAPLKSFIKWYMEDGVWIAPYATTPIMDAAFAAFLYYYWLGLAAVDAVFKLESDYEYELVVAFGLRKPRPLFRVGQRRLRKFLQWSVPIGIAMFAVVMTAFLFLPSSVATNDTVDWVVGITTAAGYTAAVTAMLILLRILGSFLRDRRLASIAQIMNIAPVFASVGGVRIARELDRALRAWRK